MNAVVMPSADRPYISTCWSTHHIKPI